MSQLELRNVTKKFGEVSVIRGVSFSIETGEFIVLVGPSGCGKSTLLRMIAGLEEISGGDLLIDGETMNEVPPAKRQLAMVFQSYALYPHMSVRKNMAFGLETMRFPKAEINRRVEDAARILQIEPLMERKPRQLSGGQKQRVAIGRAIVREPRAFLFDEPLSNLDAELRVKMRVELSELHKRLGTTMIYVTHDQVEAMTMAERIVVLNQGVVEQEGSPLELFNRPRNLFVAGFIGSPKMNFVEGRIDHAAGEATLSVQGMGAIAVPAYDTAGPVTIGFRPEAVHFGTGEGWNFSTSVMLSEHLGSETYLYLRLENGNALTVHTPGQSTIRGGETIPVFIDPRECHFFDPQGQRISIVPEK